MYLPQKSLINVGEQFEEAYLLVSGEVQIEQGEKIYKLGAGSVLGLSEGMVGLQSRYTATTLSAIQVKIIPFHKVDAIMNVLPPELKAILVTIIKRNLSP
jgi:CRP-like cAMP-binding protein